ncbi:MAG: SDR family oxidoreductase [Planctomycetaceae bacterium]|nr:SDR family oxidoreductase [Planctomycetaceae bacterium]
MSIVLITGFPGFLASGLLPKILERSPEDQAVCLVQPKFFRDAHARLEDIHTMNPSLRGRIELREGDITEASLGPADWAAVKAHVREIFHLAAVYDLSVSCDIAQRVNVEGTQNVLRFAEDSPQLQRLHYVSTCFVSGCHHGTFTEVDLDCGQSFNNHYEETKFLGEVAVRAAIDGGLPGTIYRPAIVVGDSKTGATSKYDGPYFIIRWLLRQPSIALLPVIGNPSDTRVNLVPRDFVVDVIAHLSSLAESAGETYQLADPNPLNVTELITALGEATRRRVVRIPLSCGLAKFAIDRVPGIYRLMQIPSPAIDYFVHPTHYTCDNTLRDLNGTGIAVAPFSSYVNRLVEYVRSNPAVGCSAMA